MRMRSMAILFVAAILVSPLVAAQEDPGKITWLAYSTVKSGKTADAVKMTLMDREFYDGLMQDGTIDSWGLATPINHRPDDEWNHVMWVTTSSWAKIGVWADKVQSHMASMDPEQMAALMQQAEEIYEPGSHFDEVVRHVVFSPNTPGAAPARYFYIGNYTAKEGQGEALTALYKDVVVPIADRLQAEGAITAYGMYVQELHGDKGWSHRSWYALRDLAAVDALQKAFGEISDPGVRARVAATMQPGTHSDRILAILHLGGTPAE